MEKIIINGKECVKNGKTKDGRQRYRVKGSKKIITEGAKIRCTNDEKGWAMLLYFNGMSMNKIADMMEISHVTVMNWLDLFTEEIKVNTEITDIKKVRDIELDEMYHYLHDKKEEFTSLQPLIERHINSLISI